MAHVVRLSFADPDVQTVENGDGRWVFSAVRDDAVRRVIRDADSPDAVREGLVGLTEDAVVVRVSSTQRQGSVDAYRSPTATRDLYYLRASDGSTVVTDHFRNALSYLDPADREVSRTAAADHLLFRAPIEPDTYVTGVRAVSQGEWLHWDGRADDWTRTLVDTLSPAGTTDPAVATERIDETLTSVLDAGTDETTRTMLSGGVDSTLIHTYLDDPPALVMGVDSPEFEFEREYADRALSLLGTDADQRVTVSESEFLDRLEDSIDALGFPSHYNQTVVTDATLRAASPGQYVNGEGADALFGLTGVKGCRIADWISPLLSPRAAAAVSRRVPGGAAQTYRELTQLTCGLDRPLAAGDSFANQFAFFTDPGVVSELLDEQLVADRFRRQAAYVHARTALAGSDRFSRQVAFAHLLSFFRHNTVNQWRQLGYAHGQRIFAPFKTRSMARCALSIPPSRRYIQGAGSLGSLTTKYHLKDLLDERLPEYAVTQPKGSGSLPIERYFDDGPLADVFERYSAPSFVPREAYDRHVRSYGPVTWNLITFAIWRDRVLWNPDLTEVPSTQRFFQRVTAEPPTP